MRPVRHSVVIGETSGTIFLPWFPCREFLLGFPAESLYLCALAITRFSSFSPKSLRRKKQRENMTRKASIGAENQSKKVGSLERAGVRPQTAGRQNSVSCSARNPSHSPPPLYACIENRRFTEFHLEFCKYSDQMVCSFEMWIVLFSPDSQTDHLAKSWQIQFQLKVLAAVKLKLKLIKRF